ncbi:DEAD/DEAH box helicase [Sphingomonas nostoxanthinifaciens]|uniref:DEAD/DEAH box helicase n=1 Tax=Sphingomonas nostoxanthinifaciens TaxID=2872652 RepID=UPI001CC1D2C5|nr:DEAD/DEAH box helicase [Sphingomonas nostoxanthinifaciens]UAK24048.1 DEAD/DEAH box helicase [Sphingomonas nostoxanthinifaciens]
MSTSASDLSSFDRLHPEIRRWVREQEWTGLREIQDVAIRTILGTGADVIIMAGTASGKTEAAFLPLLTKAAALDGPGLRILYVSPLKALINDQFRRLETLCERMELPLTRWHGDAPQGPKKRLLRSPAGVALITPESIEALLLRRPADAARLFQGVRAIVVDELHAFLQGPRGLHLASLLRRLDQIADVRARRVGLSATLGDADMASAWLHKPNPQSVEVLRAANTGPGIKLQIRGYEEPPESDGVDDLAEDGAQDALSRISDHLFSTLRGTNNLVFGGSRRTVEALADRLRQRSERDGVPEEFFPHHGSLSKELRETLETRLKDGKLPTTAVATTTLELGIDLGSVKSVAQVGAPRSLAGLRQRLGRSGRRGEPAILRVYLREKHLAADADPLDRLRLETVRAVACVRLLQRNWVEPAVEDASLATVALHQTLSLIASAGGVRPAAAHRLLFGRDSYLEVQPADYADLLRGAGRKGIDLLEQSPQGLLMLGSAGEQLVQGRDFYAVFSTDDEWRLVSGGRTLGTVPLTNVLGVGSLVGFAGRRWRVEAVDDRAKVLEVVPHRSGRLPRFDRPSNEPLHDVLSMTMREVLADRDEPTYLDAAAKKFLAQGRASFDELGLSSGSLVRSGNDTHLLTWRGTVVNGLLAILLMSAGLEAEVHDVGVTAVGTSPADLQALLSTLDGCPPIDDLADFVVGLRTAKLDEFIDEDLLRRMWSRRSERHLETVAGIIAELCENRALDGNVSV